MFLQKKGKKGPCGDFGHFNLFFQIFYFFRKFQILPSKHTLGHLLQILLLIFDIFFKYHFINSKRQILSLLWWKPDAMIFSRGMLNLKESHWEVASPWVIILPFWATCIEYTPKLYASYRVKNTKHWCGKNSDIL